MNYVQRRNADKIAEDICSWHEILAYVDEKAQQPIPEGEDPAEYMLELQSKRDLARKQIDMLGKELIEKAESTNAVLRSMDTEINECMDEEKRLHARRLTFLRAQKWLKGYFCDVLGKIEEQTGKAEIRTPLVTIRRQRNGGMQSLVITNPDMIPNELCRYAVKLSHTLYKKLYAIPEARAEMQAAVREPWNDAIRKELAIICDHCDGDGVIGEDIAVQCEHCGATGHRGVSGAHLEPRGYQLRIT
jgi:hypothetical protein